MKATQLLHDLGQSLWLDNITRDLLDRVKLKQYIDRRLPRKTRSRRLSSSSGNRFDLYSETYNNLPDRLIGFHHSMGLSNVLKAEHSGWLRLITACRHLFGDGLKRNVRDVNFRMIDPECFNLDFDPSVIARSLNDDAV